MFAALPIICPEGLQALESDPDALATNVYGSGPYTLESATHSAQIIYKLRQEWNWGPPRSSTERMPGTLVYKITKDQTTAANQLLTGGLDIGSVSGADVERLLADPKLGHIAVPNWNVTALSFNMREGRPFAKGEPGDILREAVYKAINPAEVNQAVYGGRAVLTPTFFRENAACFDKTITAKAPKPSIEAGKAVLTAAGYETVNGRLSKDGEPVKKLNLVSTPSLYPNGGAYIQSVLSQLGFEAELKESAADYATSIIAGNFDLAVVVANRPSPEAGTQMNSVAGTASPNGGNIGATGEGDPDWTGTYNAGLATTGDEACALFAQLQQSNLENYYAVPLTSNNYEIFYRKEAFAELPTWPAEVFGYPWFEVAVK
jgi:peptide/nickel transport system substrate-binding protein